MKSIRGRSWLVSLGVVVCASLGSEARADPPYLDQITPGELRGIAWQPGDEWGYGYWEYLPSNYDDLGPDDRLPLLVFLAGIGEYDDDPSCPGGVDLCAASDCGNDGLCRNLTWGPQQLMRAGNWDDTERPYIFISPQHPIPPFTTTEWNVANLDAFFQWVVDNYPVDPRRMYLTGMSQGGRCVYQYALVNARRFTAMAPMPGGQIAVTGAGCNFQDTGLWAFHGEDDNNASLGGGTFSPCLAVQNVHMYDHPELYGYPECVAAVGETHPPGRMSMFVDVNHSSWIQAIDPIGAGFPATEWTMDMGCGAPANFREYSAANDVDGVYSWFASLDRPDVVAPDDVELPGDTVSTSLVATVTDDDAITWEWTQTAGPAATLVVADDAELQLDDLQPLTEYTFEVLALDADGQWDRDEVTVTLLDAPVDGTTSGGSTDGGDPSATDPTLATSDTGIAPGTGTGTGGVATSGVATETGLVSDTGIATATTTGMDTDPTDPTDPSTSDGTTSGGTTGDGTTSGGTTDGGTTSGGTTGATTDTSATGSATAMTASTGDPTSDSASATVSVSTTDPGGLDSSDGGPGPNTSVSDSLSDTNGPSSASIGNDDDDESGESSDGTGGAVDGEGCACGTAAARPRDAAWSLLLLLVGLGRRRRESR